MTNLTLQDVDNFDAIVQHCETFGGLLKLSHSNKSWHLTITHDYIEGSSGWIWHAPTLMEVLQMAADRIKKQEATIDTIDNAVRLPAMHVHPDPELLRRSGMHRAAAEAQQLREMDGRTGRFSITSPPIQPTPRINHPGFGTLDH